MIQILNLLINQFQSEELQKLISPTYREIQDISAYKRNLQIITDLRPTRATQMNPESSRSHLFMTFRIVFGNTMRKITFVDLAGNESSGVRQMKELHLTSKDSTLYKP